jgi:hypothetical protein
MKTLIILLMFLPAGAQAITLARLAQCVDSDDTFIGTYRLHGGKIYPMTFKKPEYTTCPDKIEIRNGVAMMPKLN